MLLHEGGGDFTGTAAGSEASLRLNELCQPKVENLRVVIARNHDVLRLEVAMDDAGRMRLPQSLRHLIQILQKLGEWHSALMDLLAQRFTVDVLHRDEVRPVVLADFVDVRDVRMMRAAADFASRINLSIRSRCDATSAGRIFSATLRSSFVSCAR